MKLLVAMSTSVMLAAAASPARAQIASDVFPGARWTLADPASLGWSASKLEELHSFIQTLPPSSVILIDHGQIVADWGDDSLRIKISSTRKSLLSALFGIYVAEGKIDLDATLESLGIDDDPPLAAAEKRATVRMLLEARSGVYHSYVAGTPGMRAKMPERGSHAPGTFWFYNNWDFNALGTVFEQRTHSKIGSEFRNRVAQPIGMQDFRVEDMYYLRDRPDAAAYEKSIHPAYHFRLSARDLARFGYLYLRHGKWRSKQVVPEGWVDESTRSYSDTGGGAGYGYLWWTGGFDLPVKSFSSQGALAKYMFVVPDRDLVVVYLNHAEFPDNASAMSLAELKALPTITEAQMGTIMKMVLGAQRP